ncbi:MAG: hypothetical protein H6739_04660 [Alphaproteobacteria bacterium]|nr:hypothetical protein [Alphaproteobacteria bacterium]
MLHRLPLTVLDGAALIPPMLRGYGHLGDDEVALVLRPRERRGLVVRNDQGEHRTWEAEHGDAPAWPELLLPVAQIVPLLMAAQADPVLLGPRCLDGVWAAELLGHGDELSVMLLRDLGGDGRVVLHSEGEIGWAWRLYPPDAQVPRAEGQGVLHLDTAIRAALRAVLDLEEPTSEETA